MRKIYLAGAAALLASVAACGQQPTATSEQSGATQAPSDAIYSAAGSVTAVSGEGVTISHGPVPDLQWPAMTMEFRAPITDMLATRVAERRVGNGWESRCKSGGWP